MQLVDNLTFSVDLHFGWFYFVPDDKFTTVAL